MSFRQIQPSPPPPPIRLRLILSHTYAINIEQRQSCEEISLHDVSRRLDLLTHQFKRHQTESSIVLNEFVNSLEACKSSNGTEHLVRENTLLKQENKSLKEDLDGYKNVVTELNTKLTAVKNDKASLLTVI